MIGRIGFGVPRNPPSGDQTSPQVTLHSPAANLLTNQPVIVGGRVADDQSSVTRVEARLDANSFFPVPLAGDGGFQFTLDLA